MKNKDVGDYLCSRAFGWNPPNFGHLPLLNNTDGTKLSKRQNDITINTYRQKDIYPEALLNFVVSCGGGFINSKETNNIYIKPLSELISKVRYRIFIVIKLKITFFIVFYLV